MQLHYNEIQLPQIALRHQKVYLRSNSKHSKYAVNVNAEFHSLHVIPITGWITRVCKACSGLMGDDKVHGKVVYSSRPAWSYGGIPHINSTVDVYNIRFLNFVKVILHLWFTQCLTFPQILTSIFICMLLLVVLYLKSV